jgi:hypothetical protein
MSKPKIRAYKYRSHMNVDSMSAERDEKFLNECFIDTGDFQILQDFESPKCILLGRTGVGKSAAILNIKNTEDNVIEIEPSSLALSYISNSDVLNFFSRQGVKLDLFYKLLWQHVICIELLKFHFRISSENDMSRLRAWLKTITSKNKNREIAIKYLEKWNSKFWAETEERIKEITEKLESQMMAEAGIGNNITALKTAANEGSSSSITKEVIYKAQKVVNAIQIEDLSQVINLLSEEIFQDAQKKIYITIDGLDEDWVDSEIRYKLIRALIEAIKKFKRIRNLKIVIALRSDLLDRVYRYTRDDGFQEEKYEDFNIRINWSSAQLEQILDKRLQLLFKDKYTNGQVSFYDVFPEKVKSDKNTLDFIIQRTLMRPRDAIAFVNTILEKAEVGQPITAKIILDAERTHSEKRLEAIFQEWFADYPKLNHLIGILKNQPTQFSIDSISKDEVDNIVIKLLYPPEENDPIELAAKQLFEGALTHEDFIKDALSILYKVGFISVQIQSGHPFIHSSESTPNLTSAQIQSTTKIRIHPMFWWVFGNNKLKGGILDTQAQTVNF